MIAVETEKAKSVYKRAENNNGVCIPSNTTHEINLHIALDNAAFCNDILYGKSEFYGTT